MRAVMREAGRSVGRFVTFARARTAILGLATLLFVLSAVVVFARDRGHDPLWASEQPGAIRDLATSPDGARVAALVTTPNGSVVRVFDGGGRLLWERRDFPAAERIATGDGRLVLAETLPSARVVSLHLSNGTDQWDARLSGAPRALAAAGRYTVVAEQDASNTVQVWTDGRSTLTVGFASFVNSVAASDGRFAVGTRGGSVHVYESEGGEPLMRATLAYPVRSVALSANGSLVAAGGARDLSDGGGGAVHLFDVDDAVANVPRWGHETAGGVTAVRVANDGSRILALEDRPGDDVLRAFGPSSGDAVWSRTLDGAAQPSAVALRGDGRLAVAVTLDGSVVAFDGKDGDEAWEHRRAGGTVAAASAESPIVITNARPSPGSDYALLAYFHGSRELFWDNAWKAGMATLLIEAVGVLVLLLGLYLSGAFDRRL